MKNKVLEEFLRMKKRELSQLLPVLVVCLEALGILIGASLLFLLLTFYIFSIIESRYPVFVISVSILILTIVLTKIIIWVVGSWREAKKRIVEIKKDYPDWKI